MAAASPSGIREHKTDVEHDARFCGANRSKKPGTCRRGAGWGTDHPGLGRCKLHGGRTPNHRKAAAKAQAVSIAAALELEPDVAVLTMLYRACGLRAYWLSEVQQLSSLNGADPYKADKLAAALAFEREAALDSVRYAKTAHDIGIADHTLRLVEQFVGEIAGLLRALQERLAPHLDADGRRVFEETARERLELLEGGGAS